MMPAETQFTLIVLASGYGTRLQPETLSKPKPLVEVAGKPLLWHTINTFSKHYSLKEVFVSVHYMADMIQSYCVNTFQDLPIRFSNQNTDSPGESLVSLFAKLQPSGPIIVTFCDYIYRDLPVALESSVGLFLEDHYIKCVPGQFKSKCNVDENFIVCDFVKNSSTNTNLGFCGLFVCYEVDILKNYIKTCAAAGAIDYTFDIISGFSQLVPLHVLPINRLYNCGELADLNSTRLCLKE